MNYEVITLSPSNYAIIDYKNKDSNDHTSTSCVFSDNGYVLAQTHDRSILLHYSLQSQYRKRCVADYNVYATSGATLYCDLTKIWYVNPDTHLAERADEVAVSCIGLESTFDATTVTYNTKPDYTGIINGDSSYNVTTSIESEPIGLFKAYNDNASRANILKHLVDYGICIYGKVKNSSDEYDFTVPTCELNVPTTFVTLSLSTENNGFNITGMSPASGFVPKYSANTFTWGTALKGASIDACTVSSVKFRWRVTGSASYTEIDCGTTNSCTIPANTFQDDSIDWCVVVTDSWEATVTSDWMTVSTEEATSTCECVSPKNTSVETGNAITFKWNHIISTGTAPTGSDLQYSTDGSTWSTLATVTGSATETTIAAGTFSSGQYYWRARTYNTDSTAGSWSDSVSFIAVGTPSINGLRATATPQTTVSWQASDQLGYQVVIDSFDTGVVYGMDYSYKYSGYLADGVHTIKARVVNQYGLWSEWSTISITTSHTEGSAISLVVFDNDSKATLQWNTSGSYSGYIIYRDGTEIATTESTNYTDDMGIGSVEYQVRGIYSDSDNYGMSNAVEIELICNTTKIRCLESDQWLEIPNSDTQTRNIGVILSSETTSKHYLNKVYPVAELSKQKNRYMDLRVAFTEIDEANEFAGLLNNVVVCKTNKQTMIVGLITSVSMSENEFFWGFSCRIQQTEYEV